MYAIMQRDENCINHTHVYITIVDALTTVFKPKGRMLTKQVHDLRLRVPGSLRKAHLPDNAAAVWGWECSSSRNLAG